MCEALGRKDGRRSENTFKCTIEHEQSGFSRLRFDLWRPQTKKKKKKRRKAGYGVKSRRPASQEDEEDGHRQVRRKQNERTTCDGCRLISVRNRANKANERPE